MFNAFPTQSPTEQITARYARGKTWALDAAVAAFDRADSRTRFHVRVRRLLSCMERVEPLVPNAGRILEVGCGQGLFSRFLAEAAPARQVTGIDIDVRKIRAGLTVPERTGRVTLAVGDARRPPSGPWDAVVFVDVLLLLSGELQRAALLAARQQTRPGGLLIVKTQECHPSWKYCICWLQEYIVRQLGLTEGMALNFPSRQQFVEMLVESGYADIQTYPITGRIYPDVVHTARVPK